MSPAQWALGVVYLVTVVAAFPAINQRISLNGIDTYCNEIALNAILGTSQRPLPETIKYFLRDSDRLPGYLAAVTDNSRLPGLDALLSPDVGFRMTNPTGGDDVLHILRSGLDEFQRLRNYCILRNGGKYGIKDATYTEDISAKLEDIVPAQNENVLPSTGNGLKRAQLALNPTGWRRKREATPPYQTMREFLRSIRQLQIKRKQRLQFNPTGW